MKNLTISIVALILIGAFVFAKKTSSSDIKKPEATEKIIVLVNTASWCPTCVKNGPRVEKDVVSQFMKDSNFKIVVNNLSDDATKATSKAACEKAGITEIASSNKGTGMIYFINAKSKKVVDKVSVSETNEVIIAAFKASLNK